jgi:hypothetical protein
MRQLSFVALVALVCISLSSKAQYVQPERDDTVRLMPKAPFDTLEVRKTLAKGTSTIKGVAFIRPVSQGFGIKTGKKIFAYKTRVLLFPVTPYLLEYLDLKKKANPKKLKFAYLSHQAWYYHLEAITNSTGEFTFPDMKPGKYYVEAVLNWQQSGTYNQYNGSGYNNYGGQTDYYSRQNYVNNYADLLYKFVEVEKDGETVEVKLK